MKYRLVDLLACPMCKQFPLELFVLQLEEHPERRVSGRTPLCELYCALLRTPLKELTAPPPCGDCIKKEIISGALYCASCGRWYPVMDSIPHMLPDELRARERQRELEFLKRYADALPQKITLAGRPHNLAEHA
ncbi:MAG: Trm112 family protein [Fervidicoccaceae archaeon]